MLESFFVAAIAALLSAPVSAIAAEPTPIGCPAAPVTLQSGLYAITQTPCTLDAGITLEGTAILLVSGVDLRVDGSITLRGDSALRIQHSVLTLANHFVQEHEIEARDRATLELEASVLRTNAGATTTSLATQYSGYDDSRLLIKDSFIEVERSWLLAAFYDRSVLQTINSTFLPTETYPHDSATILIEGGDAHGVWLEFPPGSKATVANIPSRNAPFDFDFGRDTPGVVNVGYQVRVINGIAGFVIASHSMSDVTVKDNQGPVVIGYFFEDVETPQSLAVTPSLRDATLTHQGRTLRLVNATLEGFGWQIYAANPGVSSPKAVRIANSVLNELGALDAAKFAVHDSVIEFAVVAALGQDSSIRISRSTLNSQSLIAEKNGRLEIRDSEIFGSLVQARDDARILLLNTALNRNVCHAGCPVPCVENGGCNPYNDPDVDTRFQVDGRAEIVALGLDPVVGPIEGGDTYAFIGDVLVLRAPECPVEYSYDLSFRRARSGKAVPITQGGTGSRQNAMLGRLDTTGLAPGRYMAVLRLLISGTPLAKVERPFTVARRRQPHRPGLTDDPRN